MFRVKAKERGWPGRWRSGRYFPAAEWTYLQPAEITDAILADPVLVVDEVGPEQPSLPVPKVRRRR